MPTNKIIYLCNLISDAERHRFYLADSALKKISSYKKILEENGVEVETLSFSAPRKDFFRGHWQFFINKTGGIAYYVFRLFFEFSRLIKYAVYLARERKEYSAILSYSYATQNVLLCCFGHYFLSKKVILDYEDGLFSHRTRYRYYSFLEKIMLNISSGCILVNEGLKKRLPARKPAVVINGIFMHKEKTVNSGQSPIGGRKTLLYSGELSFDWGLAYLLKVFLSENAQSIDFHITGTGRNKESLVKFISEHALRNVFFHGYVPLEFLNDLEERIDGFILFQNEDSPIYETNFPSKLFHYLIFGKPVFFNGCSLFSGYERFANANPIVNVENSANEILSVFNNGRDNYHQIVSEIDAYNNENLRKLNKVLFEC